MDNEKKGVRVLLKNVSNVISTEVKQKAEM